LDLALAGERAVSLYPYPPQANQARTVFNPGGNNRLILSLEAADLNGNGKPELFVSYFNPNMSRPETAIVELGPEGFKTLDEIPWLVRAHQTPEGGWVLAAQQLQESRTFPFSAIYPLVYKDGRYRTGLRSIRLRRAEWIYNFTQINLGDAGPAVLTYTSTDRLRVDLKKGHWSSSDSFGRTPVRFSWSDRILECHPRPAVHYRGPGPGSVFVIRNIPALGGLAAPFGKFSGAEVLRLEWDGLGLRAAWKSQLSGYASALALVRGEELAVAVAGSGGSSAVWIYDL
jgi:hypothetical protein